MVCACASAVSALFPPSPSLSSINLLPTSPLSLLHQSTPGRQRSFFIVLLQSIDPEPSAADAPSPVPTFTREHSSDARAAMDGDVQGGLGKVRLAAEMTYKPETSSHEVSFDSLALRCEL